MPAYLTAVPNVSWPQPPCLPDQTGLNDGAGNWLCPPNPVTCPAGTILWRVPPAPFSWQFCAPVDAVPALTIALGPNAAAGPIAPQAVPALDVWASILLVGILAAIGARVMR